MIRRGVNGLLVLLALVGLGVVAPSAGAKDLKIAMVLWRGETDAEKGFRQGLKDLGTPRSTL